jgi:hypothetical protein
MVVIDFEQINGDEDKFREDRLRTDAKGHYLAPSEDSLEAISHCPVVNWWLFDGYCPHLSPNERLLISFNGEVWLKTYVCYYKIL